MTLEVKVIKRDGSMVSFDKMKIIRAVEKALLEVDGDLTYGYIADNVAKSVENYIRHNNLAIIEVEKIQDLVEEFLTDGPKIEWARAYIRYRYKREMARGRYAELMETVAEKLNATNVQNQNANVDEQSFGGRMGEMNSAVARQYALEYLISPKARNNHERNRIYIHDLDNYAVGSHNCLTIPFDDLLANGFNTRQTDVRPAQSVSTAFQLVAVIFQLQSLQQFGGVSASHIDWTMVPYVRKSFAKHYKVGLGYFLDIPGWEDIDYSIQNMLVNAKEYPITDGEWKAYCPKAARYAYDMTQREVYQAVEAMYHNLNTLQSRSGNQLPFTSINYGTCTLPEGRMITKAILDVSIKGIGALHKTSVFPCGIFQCMKGVNRAPGDPNYDLYRLALRSTAQRLYPNYANVDWSTNEGYDRNDPRTYVSTMGK